MNHINETLYEKIVSINTTPKLKAVIGFIFDIILTDPIITDIYITKGGQIPIETNQLVLCSTSTRPLHQILSNYESLKENWDGFFELLKDNLTEEEKEFIDTQFKKKLKLK